MLVIRVGFYLSGFVPFLFHIGEYHPEAAFSMHFLNVPLYLCSTLLLSLFFPHM